MPDAPLETEALEVQSSVLLDALARPEPLETMLARSPDVVGWMRWLADLAEARFILWRLPPLARRQPLPYFIRRVGGILSRWSLLNTRTNTTQKGTIPSGKNDSH